MQEDLPVNGVVESAEETFVLEQTRFDREQIQDGEAHR